MAKVCGKKKHAHVFLMTLQNQKVASERVWLGAWLTRDANPAVGYHPAPAAAGLP